MNDAVRPLRAPSRIAGSALLLMVLLSAVGVFGILGNLIVPGDASKTVANISGSELLFRTGVATLVVIVVLDIIIAGALFEVFASVNRSVSAMAAWFRLAYAAVFLVAICQLLAVPALLDEGNQLLRAVDAFNNIWKAGLILFAFHLLLIGHLAYRSGFMPRIFGILLMVNGLGYLVDGFAIVLVPGYSFSVAQFVFVGEAALIFWLLIRGPRITTAQVPERRSASFFEQPGLGRVS